MFGRWKGKAETGFKSLGPEVGYYIVRLKGGGFRLYDGGRVGFYTARGVTAPTRENAVAQALAIIPVQLQPLGTPEADFTVEAIEIHEATLQRIRQVPSGGFTFYPDETQTD